MTVHDFYSKDRSDYDDNERDGDRRERRRKDKEKDRRRRERYDFEDRIPRHKFDDHDDFEDDQIND